MYTPVEQRNSQGSNSGYVPVGQRAAPLKVVSSDSGQIISGVVQAHPTQKIVPQGFVGSVPTKPIPAPTKLFSIKQSDDGSSAFSTLPPLSTKAPTAVTGPQQLSNDYTGNMVTQTINELPGALGKTLQTIARAPFRAGVATDASIANNPEPIVPTTPLQKFFTGDEPIVPIARQTSDLELKLKDKGLGKASLPIALAGVVTSTGIDLTPLGLGGADEKLGKQAIGELTELLGKGVVRDEALNTIYTKYGTKVAKAIEEKALPKIEEQIAKTTPENITTYSAESATSQLGPTQKTQEPLPPLSPKENVSYAPNVAEASGDVKERGFLTSLKEDPKTASAFKDEVNNYDVAHHPETIAKAKNLIEQSPEEATRLAFSDNKNAVVQAVRIAMIDDAAAKGDVTLARKIGAVAAPELTEAGQFVEAAKLLSGEIDTPAKAIIVAQQELDKANKAVLPKFEDKINSVGREFNKIHEDAVDKIIAETPELQEPKPKVVPKELPSLDKKIQAKIDRGGMPPADELASKITPYYKAKQPNPIKDMVQTLYKLAEEQLPVKGKKPPRDAIELIGQALRDKDTYKSTWLQAQDIVREKWKDNPEALGLLDKYFNKTLLSGETEHAALPIAEKQVGTAVKQEIKSQGVNLGDIVRQHYSVVDQSGKDLQTKLIEKANVPFKEAQALTAKIQDRFNELVGAKKDSILKSIFAGQRSVTADKSFAQKIIELSNLGAFDKPALKEQLAQKLGLATLDDDLAKNLITQANVIQQLPYGYEKFKQTQNLLKLIADRAPTNKLDVAANLLNIPKTLMSSYDLSFGLRQGLPAAYSFPKEFTSAFKGQFKQFGGERFFEEAMDRIMKNPDFKLAEQSGISFTDLGSAIGRREEAFQSAYAEKIPILGKGVRMSARAYTGMSNQLRMDIFTHMLDDAEVRGLNPRVDTYLAKDYARLANDLTGRGSLGKYERAGPLLNAVFYSPRLTVSRLSLLTSPISYMGAEPAARKAAMASLFKFAAGTSMILGLVKLSGLNVGTDWTSSDFGKIKIGNTRIDLTGSFQQYGRMAGQLITGKYTSSSTGKEYTLGEGYKPMTRLDILSRQIESKEAPILSFVSDMLRGTDLVGNKVTLGSEMAKSLTPMVIQDMRDLYKDDPSLLPLGALGIFGAGIQTYAPTPPKNSGKLPKLPTLPKLPKLPK